MFKTMKSKVVGAGLGLALAGTALGGVVMTGVTAASAQTPPTTPPVTQSQPADAPETASKAEANEPQLPGGGHADADGVDVQHDFQGVE